MRFQLMEPGMGPKSHYVFVWILNFSKGKPRLKCKKLLNKRNERKKISGEIRSRLITLSSLVIIYSAEHLKML